MLPAGAVAGCGSHPLESAAFPRRMPESDIGAAVDLLLVDLMQSAMICDNRNRSGLEASHEEIKSWESHVCCEMPFPANLKAGHGLSTVVLRIFTLTALP